MADFKAVVIGGSAGSFAVMSKILAEISPNFSLPIVVCMHRLKYVRAGFVETLSMRSNLPVQEPHDKDPIENGNVYIAPANYHMMVEYDKTFSLSIEAPEFFCRPAVDHTLSSAAKVWRDKCVGIILTGANKDGAHGLKAIADRGGYTIVQDPATADMPVMPEAALQLVQPNAILSPQGIIDFLNSL